MGAVTSRNSSTRFVHHADDARGSGSAEAAEDLFDGVCNYGEQGTTGHEASITAGVALPSWVLPLDPLTEAPGRLLVQS